MDKTMSKKKENPVVIAEGSYLVTQDPMWYISVVPNDSRPPHVHALFSAAENDANLEDCILCILNEEGISLFAERSFKRSLSQQRLMRSVVKKTETQAESKTNILRFLKCGKKLKGFLNDLLHLH